VTLPAAADADTPHTQPEAAEAVDAGVVRPPPPDTSLAPLGPVTGCSRLALVMVVDRSGSMTGNPLDMAKTAVSHAASVLGADDCVEVIAFDSVPTRIVSLRQVAASIDPEVARIAAGGGTDIVPALRIAYEDIGKAVTAKKKHMLVLTDGQSATQGIDDLLRAMASDKITISTVAFGSNSDEAFLKKIAERGTGRFWRVNDATQLPRTFEAEVKQALR
jgi:uncharacterized protein with von Willebrand factor type A (vWA) domain